MEPGYFTADLAVELKEVDLVELMLEVNIKDLAGQLDCPILHGVQYMQPY